MKVRTKRRRLRSVITWLLWAFALQLVLVNISAALYAHKLTHLHTPAADTWTKTASGNIFARTWRLFTGPRLYKQISTDTPSFAYSTIWLQTKKGVKIAAWHARADSTSKGTILMFHGLLGSKNTLIREGSAFLSMGYSILMVDARAHGQSEGSSISLGYYETEEVKIAHDYIAGQGEKHIFLYGTSLGAVEVIKAVSDFHLKPAGIIIEMPFLSLQSHLKGRARMLGFPAQPFASLTSFWIGVEHGFNGLSFNAVKSAADIHCPVLMQYGEKDQLVLKHETDRIYKSIASTKKKLVIYQDTGHELFLKKDPATWMRETGAFLASCATPTF